MKASDDQDVKLGVQCTYGALFFGVPSQGMDTKALANMVEGTPGQFTLTLLNQSHGFELRHKQHQEFCRAFNYEDLKITYFYEQRKSPTVQKVLVFSILILTQYTLSVWPFSLSRF